MPDNKTVTFDASQYQLVPKVPTDEMLDAASHASMQHLLDCINDPVKARELGSEENARKTHASRYQSMLDAAPTPAAQSAGQEPVAHIATRKMDGERFLVWPNNVASYKKYTDDFDVVDLYAAPVNGGEREEKPQCSICHDSGWFDVGGPTSEVDGHFPNLEQCDCVAERAADAQQVGARYEVEHSPVVGMPFWAEVTFEQYEMYRLNGSPVRRIPVAAPCKGTNCGATDGISHSAECIAEHDAALSSPAKVGGDAQRRFETYLRSIWTQGYGCAKDEDGRYRDGNAQSLWECWSAALSADGGEDKRDAERYRFLRDNVTNGKDKGYALTWLDDCFYPVNDPDAHIDAAIAANQSGKGGE